MQFAEGAGQTILDEIVGGDDVARQCTRVAPKARDFGFDLPVSVGHERLLPLSIISRRADPSGRSLSARCNPMMSGPAGFV